MPNKTYKTSKDKPVTVNEPAVTYQTAISQTLKEINALLDFKITEPIFRCTTEQREAITQAQQAIARGEGVTDNEMKNAVELCLNEN